MRLFLVHWKLGFKENKTKQKFLSLAETSSAWGCCFNSLPWDLYTAWAFPGTQRETHLELHSVFGLQLIFRARTILLVTRP